MRQQNNIKFISTKSLKQSLQIMKLIVKLFDFHLCQQAIVEEVDSNNRLSTCNDRIAFAYCAQMNKFEIAKYLISKDVLSIDTKDEQTLFHFATS